MFFDKLDKALTKTVTRISDGRAVRAWNRAPQSYRKAGFILGIAVLCGFVGMVNLYVAAAVFACGLGVYEAATQLAPPVGTAAPPAPAFAAKEPPARRTKGISKEFSAGVRTAVTAKNAAGQEKSAKPGPSQPPQI